MSDDFLAGRRRPVMFLLKYKFGFRSIDVRSLCLRIKKSKYDRSKIWNGCWLDCFILRSRSGIGGQRKLEVEI